MPVATYTKAGTKATTAAKLNKQIFGVAAGDHQLLKQAYVAYLANGRKNLARTKTRGLVSGGGKKPWKQKGTGRARFGSSRNPIWRGGGIAFGPTGIENYAHKLPVARKRQAIRQALSLAADSGKLIIIEDLAFKAPKTSEAAALFTKIGIAKNALIVVAAQTPEITRSIRNLADIKLVSARYLNVFDLLNADHIVITNEALSVITDWLGSGKKPADKEGVAA